MTPHECIMVCHALATAGRLEEAKANLRRNAPCLKCEEGLDLLARVELALGNEGEARRLWNEALEKGVGGEAARKALVALGSVGWRHRGLVLFMKHFLRVAAILSVGFMLGLCWNGRNATQKDCNDSNCAPPITFKEGDGRFVAKPDERAATKALPLFSDDALDNNQNKEN